MLMALEIQTLVNCVTHNHLGERIAEARELAKMPRQTDAARVSKQLENSDPENFKSFSQQWLSRIEDDPTPETLDGAHRGRVRTLEHIVKLDLGAGGYADPEGPPTSLEYNPDGVYIRLRGLVSGGNGEPEELEGDLFFVPRHILRKYNVRNAETELAGYMVNGNSMFYASEGVRARGLKNGDLIAVHRFLRPSAETPMVVAWDKQEEKMLVKLMDEGEDWVVFRSVNSSANPPITRHKDEIHLYGTVIMRITAEP
jgi:hypothetical protein